MRFIRRLLGRLFHLHRWQYRDERADDGTFVATRRCLGCPAREVWGRDDSGWTSGDWFPAPRRKGRESGGGGHA